MAARTPRGRPRSFDTQQALRGAMDLFWQKGYDAATLPDLLKAMGGISPPSFYAAFGSKEQVFADALQLYQEKFGPPVMNAIRGGATAKDAFAAFLRAGADTFAGHGTPTGCLIVLGGVNSSNPAITRMVDAVHTAGIGLIRERLRKGVADGDVPKTADLGAIVAFYRTQMYGLALGARDGMTHAALCRVADAAMAAWDTLVGTVPKKRAKAPKAARPRPARARA